MSGKVRFVYLTLSPLPLPVFVFGVAVAVGLARIKGKVTPSARSSSFPSYEEEEGISSPCGGARDGSGGCASASASAALAYLSTHKK